METYVEFRSHQFPPYDGEEVEINPGRYGKRLAEFLQRGLSEKGFKAGDLIAEDWGWLIPIENELFQLWIGCGNYEEYPGDGFLCFIHPHKQFIRKLFRRIDVSVRVGQLRDAIDDLLTSETEIRKKRWWTYEDFHRQTAPR